MIYEDGNPPATSDSGNADRVLASYRARLAQLSGPEFQDEQAYLINTIPGLELFLFDGDKSHLRNTQVPFPELLGRTAVGVNGGQHG